MKLSICIEKVCDKQSKQCDNYSYLTMHTHLHGDQLNKEFNELWVCHELMTERNQLFFNSFLLHREAFK